MKCQPWTNPLNSQGLETASLLLSFILLMTIHPEVQKRAREEIHTVIGKDRVPVLSDRMGLPYTCAVIAEVARLRPPVNMGTCCLFNASGAFYELSPSISSRRKR